VHCILKGLDIHRVAVYLGDTVKTVAEHYLPMAEAMMQQAADILNRPVPAVRRTSVSEPPIDSLPTVETDRIDSVDVPTAWRNWLKQKSC
jgi:imidazoleglycerol phosphate dehydratase HisB